MKMLTTKLNKSKAARTGDASASSVQRVVGLRLGDTWVCKCGKEHKLSGGWLAAHWRITLFHTCGKCGAKHKIEGGEITLIEPNTKLTDSRE